MNKLPGGQDGWTVKADRTKAAYRHLVWKLSVTQESWPELRQLSVPELQTRAAEAGASRTQMEQGATHDEQKAVDRIYTLLARSGEASKINLFF